MVKDTIDHATLVKLVDAGAVRAAHVVGRAGGWGVTVACGKTARSLAVQRGRERLFSKLDTVVTYLKRIGVDRFDVDAMHYDSRHLGRSRPDRAEALKHAHKAAAYDKWFREQVKVSLDDTHPNISHEQVAERWAKKRVQLQRRAKARSGAKV
jgi:hypothetical protein